MQASSVNQSIYAINWTISKFKVIVFVCDIFTARFNVRLAVCWWFFFSFPKDREPSMKSECGSTLQSINHWNKSQQKETFESCHHIRNITCNWHLFIAQKYFYYLFLFSKMSFSVFFFCLVLFCGASHKFYDIFD